MANASSHVVPRLPGQPAAEARPGAPLRDAQDTRPTSGDGNTLLFWGQAARLGPHAPAAWLRSPVSQTLARPKPHVPLRSGHLRPGWKDAVGGHGLGSKLRDGGPRLTHHPQCAHLKMGVLTPKLLRVYVLIDHLRPISKRNIARSYFMPCSPVHRLITRTVGFHPVTLLIRKTEAK